MAKSDSMRRNMRYDLYIKPPQKPEKKETVEEFLARGGKIQYVPMGASAETDDKPWGGPRL